MLSLLSLVSQTLLLGCQLETSHQGQQHQILTSRVEKIEKAITAQQRQLGGKWFAEHIRKTRHINYEGFSFPLNKDTNVFMSE